MVQGWLSALPLASQLADDEAAASISWPFLWSNSSLYALHITSAASNIGYRQYSSPDFTHEQRGPG